MTTDIKCEPGARVSVALGDAAPGTPLKVERILGGHRLTSRLSAMGILPGEIVTVLQNDKCGPILLERSEEHTSELQSLS
jgi:Fe2+ transport system protein FeoA